MESVRLNLGARRLAFTAATLPILTGLSVLVGWQFDIQILKSIIPGLVNMNPITAVGFIAAGKSLLLYLMGRAPGMAIPLAALVGFAGALRLWSYVSGVDVGQDAWLFHQKVILLPRHNPIAPNTALNLLLV